MEQPPLRRLGEAIRKRREALGMNQTQLGQLILMSKSSISRIENGEVAIEQKNIVAFDTALKADGMIIDLWSFATEADYSAELITSQEERASRILEFDNRVIPGLLQTSDYARGVMRAARQFDSDAEIERDVKKRIERQSIWQRENKPTGWFVFEESVVYKPYGGPKAMHDQLAHVLEMAARPRVFVQVVPYSATNHPGVEGPLRVLFYPDAPPLAYTESRYTGRTSGTDADDATTNFDLIRGAALSSADSVEFIRTVNEERYASE